MKVRVERLGEKGFGVAKVGKKRIHVPFTAPGDVVEIRKWHREKRILVAHDYEVLETAEERVEPRCPYFGRCGGCILQHIPYETQVEFKEASLEKSLGFEVEVLPSPLTYGHRNRIDIAIATTGIGFRRRGTWWDVVDIDECPVFGGRSREAIAAMREAIEELNLERYDIRNNAGFLKYMVLREGKFTEEFMINVVTAEGHLPGGFEEYFPFADSLYWSVNRTPSDVSFGEVERFWGKPYITERLGDVNYLIHPNSFFQTNSYQAENLVKVVSKLVEGEKVLDLYSGVGTFGVYLAKRGFKVEGIDVNPFAVEMAKKNAALNGVEAIFSVGEDRDVETLRDYDSVVVDPPRAGLHPNLIKRLIRDTPETLVYVSCNPKTLAENLRVLEETYEVEEATGLDMFPHTPHVETVVKLKRKV